MDIQRNADDFRVTITPDQQTTINHIVARIKARTLRQPCPSTDDLVSDQLDWCGVNTKGAWSKENNGYAYTFSFERQEDAALFRLFQGGQT